MASAQIATSVEGEGDGNFNFDKWVTDNGLSTIKNKLIEHGLTTPTNISTQSPQFISFMSDPVVLTTTGIQMVIPQLFAAISKVPKNASRFVHNFTINCARITTTANYM